MKLNNETNHTVEQKNNIELEDFSNYFFVPEYSHDIFDFLKSKEKEMYISSNYMNEVQTEIVPSMRTILIDWLNEVCIEHKLSESTLFLSVNITDRYLTKNKVKKSNLQLIGITSLFLAA
jgi:S-phase entry cyclin 5/6